MYRLVMIWVWTDKNEMNNYRGCMMGFNKMDHMGMSKVILSGG